MMRNIWAIELTGDQWVRVIGACELFGEWELAQSIAVQLWPGAPQAPNR